MGTLQVSWMIRIAQDKGLALMPTLLALFLQRHQSRPQRQLHMRPPASRIFFFKLPHKPESLIAVHLNSPPRHLRRYSQR